MKKKTVNRTTEPTENPINEGMRFTQFAKELGIYRGVCRGELCKFWEIDDYVRFVEMLGEYADLYSNNKILWEYSRFYSEGGLNMERHKFGRMAKAFRAAGLCDIVHYRLLTIDEKEDAKKFNPRAKGSKYGYFIRPQKPDFYIKIFMEYPELSGRLEQVHGGR